jgi:hypothetical protein
MEDAMPDGPERDARPDPRKSARDAGAEIGSALTRAAEVTGAALIQAGQVAGDALLGFFGGGSGRAGDALVTDVVPELAPLHPLSPGDEVQTRVRLVNAEAGASEPFALTATDLTSDAGDKIPADSVVVPAHQRVLAANAWDTVRVTLRVPDDAKPGVYSGELRADAGGVEPAPLVLEVR